MIESKQMVPEEQEKKVYPISFLGQSQFFIAPDGSKAENTKKIQAALLYLVTGSIVMLDGRMYNLDSHRDFISTAQNLCNNQCDSEEIEKFFEELISLIF